MAIPLLIVQPTSFCNLDCRYCYVPNREVKDRLPGADLRLILENINLALGDEFELQWHAGEPLTAGKSFYRQANATIRAFEASRGVRVHQLLQTNGTLIDDEWCEIFNEFEIGIGVSIDGPQPLHDLNRRARSGMGTHQSVMRGIDLLRRHGRNPAALSVVTLETIRNAELWFNFFVDNGFDRLGFNIEEIENANFATSFGQSDTYDAQFRAFIEETFALYLRNREKIDVREYRNVVQILQEIRKNKDFRRTPEEAKKGQISTVDRLGNVYPYSPEFAGIYAPAFNGFTIGNLKNDSLNDIFKSEAAARIDDAISRSVERCRSECAYFQLCGGVFFSNKFAEHGHLYGTETGTCRRSVKIMFDAVIGLLETQQLA